MTLAVVRNLASPRRLRTVEDVVDFAQEIVDQYALSMAAAGLTDGHIAASRAAIIEFARSLGGPLWTASVDDADRYLKALRQRGLANGSVYTKALHLARFYDFVVFRYQGDIHALTDCVVEQVIDEFNRPASDVYYRPRVPPSDREIEALFGAWGPAVSQARKYLPAARDYFAASLWRRLGLRISESVMLDIRDWRPDLGEHGKLHVRFGKGSRGRGHKPRLVPAINGADRLIDWWLAEVRHQYGADWADPDAPMLPSERSSPGRGRCARVGGNALRDGLKSATARFLPAWDGRMSPHVLRHYCASSLYLGGMDLKAVQELLGHEWLSTTTRYIHVHSDHIEQAWAAANTRLESRFTMKGG
jgi:site-specific recombinase XerD